MSQRGAYEADRAAGLSGVPKSTVHYWAREGILVPSISAERIKLWSYSDLMALRTIHWLRHIKSGGSGSDIPAATMPAVRKALHTLAELDLALWTEDHGPTVAVDAGGAVVILAEDGPLHPGGQRVITDALDLTGPFDVGTARGPDLHSPRPLLRIVPGKLAGAPHVLGTRIESEALAGIAARGFTNDEIAALYPEIAVDAVSDALDLESSIAGRATPQVA
jgi:uncharacterized protein (DUF433 family)